MLAGHRPAWVARATRAVRGRGSVATTLLAADVLLATGKRPMPAGHRPAWVARATRAVRGRGSVATTLLAADVLLATDLRHRQPRLLQRLEAGIDHVRVAAQVGDVGDRVGRELGQELLHVTVAHVGMRLRRTGGGQLAR